jgi:phosphotransferase system HPr (HPr) family protein
MQELDIELADDVKLHARPAALIVNIVGRYGTPVELEVNGHRCNAGSILDLLVAIGSNPEARHFKFRGDISPLRDIARLFEVGLGEGGIEKLPTELQYLRGGLLPRGREFRLPNTVDRRASAASPRGECGGLRDRCRTPDAGCARDCARSRTRHKRCADPRRAAVRRSRR